ncbi:MAG: ABC transporter permease [Pseudorhodoplanes sp.]|jgi:putative ABC transport system permease protein|nr:ABC transporter permease [Pseudorhodoplanes sp.]
MTYRDAVISAVDALRLNKLRSALTMLGIIIGVAAVIAMIAVGGGAREQVVAQIRSLGSNLLVVMPGNVTAGGVRMGAGAASTLTDEDATAIMAEVPSVQITAPNMRGTGQIIAGGMNWATAIFGIDLGWFEARDWEVEHGRMFEPEEIARGAQVAIIGQTVARNLYGGIDPVGEEIRIRNVPLRIIGVMGRKGQTTWGQDQDDVVFVPLNTARQRVLGRNLANARAVGSIYVKVREGESISATEEEIKVLLRQRHRIQPGADDDFSIRNLADIAATREASARTLELLLAAVAGVSLMVGGIGIMNIMLVSVTERTREIGLRLAVGARQWDILRQFLLESAGLAVIGGAIGIAIGIGAAYVISKAAGWPLLIEPGAVLLAVLFSGLVGVFFGWYPALRASRLDPIEALRHT